MKPGVLHTVRLIVAAATVFMVAGCSTDPATKARTYVESGDK